MFWAIFSQTKKVLGKVLGDFFTNSSGHPGSGRDQCTFGFKVKFLVSAEVSTLFHSAKPQVFIELEKVSSCF
jgi:hypothetical protein